MYASPPLVLMKEQIKFSDHCVRLKYETVDKVQETQ
jgi:hypothetical protein